MNDEIPDYKAEAKKYLTDSGQCEWVPLEEIELSYGKWSIEASYEWTAQGVVLTDYTATPILDLITIPEDRIREILGG